MRINGEQIELGSSGTLDELIVSLGYQKERIAVELNGKIIPKKDYPSTTVSNKDSLEIVNFVGGG